jgi:hypothetical protein
MQENLLHRRYCVQVYGGQQFINKRRNISRTAMFVRDLETLTEGMRFP